MAYRTMKSIFHEGKVPLEDELARRLALPETIPLGFALEEDELFFTMASDVYQLLLEAARLDKEIAVLTRSLSQRALQQYRESLLIDEIVLTNDIEGIYSTRKEIYEVMESLKRNCGKGRFLGLVRKYTMLSSQQEIPLSTCEDIRALYDELVLDEVAREKAGNRPDGRIFRAGKVNIYDGGGKAIHSGVYPEKRIVELLEKSLTVLNRPSIETLVRVALFHFLFGYIHPFYDGNGRLNRFISSYVIAKDFEPIVGLCLSSAIQRNIGKYHKAYTSCENPLNRGDLTPFVIEFCKIAIQAMKTIRDSLAERQKRLLDAEAFLRTTLASKDSNLTMMANEIASATMFSTYGSSPYQLGELFGVTRQTVYSRVEPLKELGIIMQSKVGRRTYYTIKLDTLTGCAGGTS